MTGPQALSPFDLAAVALLIAVGGLYARGAVRRLEITAGHPVRDAFLFVLGWAAMLIAVVPPVDAAAIARFSAHMGQHELMMLVAVPLMVLARPLPTWLSGLSGRARAVAVRGFQRGVLADAWRFGTLPLVAWALHGISIWGWHIPALYDRAVGNEAVHAVQHAMFVGTSVLFWWGMVCGRYGRAGYGAAVFYVFTTVMHTGILGAMLTFADVPLYESYRHPVDATDPLEDQQLAGLLMWVPAGLVLTVLGIGLFAAWLGEAERRAVANAKLTIQKSGLGKLCVAAFLVAVAAASCSRNQDVQRVARELTGGDPAHGKVALAKYGCDTCHTIPGVMTAKGTVGPPLNQLGRRTYLAGRLDNTPENLMLWIREPRRVDPETAMPETGVSERDGRDIAAYLYTLR